MVSSRRQISRDEDRYGGFADVAEVVGEREISDDILKMKSYVTPSEAAAQVDPIEKKESRRFDPSASVEARVVTAPPATERAERRAVQQPSAPVRPRRISDVMPEIVRPVSKEKTIAAQPAPVIRERKLTASAKRALIIYMSVVLAVVAGIIATGVAVSSVSAQVIGFESVIAAQEEMITSQRETLAQLGNEAVIEDAAENFGMVKVENTTPYDRLEIGTTEEEASGVFDSVRDWFNAIFGG